MGSLRRMGAFLGLVARDDETRGDYGYDYPDGDDEADFAGAYPARGDSESVRRPVAVTADAPATHGALAMQLHPQERRQADTGGASRPLTVKITGFSEARIIGERYRDGASVILDMTELTDSDARRVVDFAAGLAFALHGSIDKVTARVFMLLPPHADISADDRRAFAAGSYRRG